MHTAIFTLHLLKHIHMIAMFEFTQKHSRCLFQATAPTHLHPRLIAQISTSTATLMQQHLKESERHGAKQAKRPTTLGAGRY